MVATPRRRLAHLRQQLHLQGSMQPAPQASAIGLVGAGDSAGGPGGEHDWSVPLVDSQGHRSTAADDLKFFRENFTKLEAMVRMRDGVQLFTVVYAPHSGGSEGATHPILLQRTPYSCAPYGADAWAAPRGPMKTYAREGFIFAQQDVRGRNGSEGEFQHMRPQRGGCADKTTGANECTASVDESTDTFDTIEWLVRTVPRNNGRVGLLGISYPGFYAAVRT